MQITLLSPTPLTYWNFRHVQGQFSSANLIHWAIPFSGIEQAWNWSNHWQMRGKTQYKFGKTAFCIKFPSTLTTLKLECQIFVISKKTQTYKRLCFLIKFSCNFLLQKQMNVTVHTFWNVLLLSIYNNAMPPNLSNSSVIEMNKVYTTWNKKTKLLFGRRAL